MQIIIVCMALCTLIAAYMGVLAGLRESGYAFAWFYAAAMFAAGPAALAPHNIVIIPVATVAYMYALIWSFDRWNFGQSATSRSR